MRVTNTAAQRLSLLDGLPGMIKASEARGQAQLVEADQLPAEGLPAARSALEAMGIEILGPTEGDPLFYDVRLPAGWKKVPTDHSMWSYLVDADGWKRAALFYKAAFYDRKAHMRLRHRYTYATRCLSDGTRIVGYVIDEREPPKDTPEYRIIWQTEPLVFPTKQAAWDSDADARQDAACKAWLDENLPNWQDPLAYWNDPERPTVGVFPPWRA